MRVVIPLLLAFISIRANPLPTLAFEARKSEYVVNGAGYRLSVTPAGAVLKLGDHVLRMSAIGMKPKSSVEGLDKMPGRANYMVGDLHQSFDLFGRVRWRGVYPGIDVIFRGNQDHLEYDFEVAPDRDPSSISLAFNGVDGLSLDPDGDLILHAGSITIRQPRPVAFQWIDGQRQAVEARYWIDDRHHVHVRTGPYDRRRLLVIDPEIVFDKQIGGSAQSYSYGFARDAQGNLYLTGITAAPDFPTVNPLQNHLGTSALVSTADGKTWTSSQPGAGRIVNAIAAAPSSPSMMYAGTVAGISRSVDAGTTWTSANAGVTGAAGTLAVDPANPATVYAGTPNGVFITNDGGDTWRAANGIAGSVVSVAVDPSNPATVYASAVNTQGFFRSADAGQTWTAIPIGPPNQAPVVESIAFGPKGTVILGTTSGVMFLADGGVSSGASQPVYNNQGLVVSPADPNLVLLTGPNGLQRSTDGGRSFSRVLPSVNFITPSARLAIDPRNPSTIYVADAYLYRTTDAGETWTQFSFPFSLSVNSLLVSPADSRVFVGTATQSTTFVTKLSPDGTRILYSTYLGGSGNDGPNAIAVDASGSAYIAGTTTSRDFPTTPGAFQTKSSGTYDIFVSKLSPDGSKLVYSTLLGASNAAPTAIAIDNSGNAILTGRAQNGFPTTANAILKEPSKSCDVQIPLQIIPLFGAAFVTKLSPAGDSLVYSTLLGGNCVTYGQNLALDAKGNAWVVGTTVSTDFPVTSDALQSKPAGGYYDGYLARFNTSGGLDYATYIGGPGYDTMTALAFDASGNVFLAGESGGLSQPSSPGAFQSQAKASCPVFSIGPGVYSLEGNGMVLKLDPTARSVLRLTYLGAPGCLNPNSIAVDAADQPWIAGSFSGTSTLQTANPVQLAGYGFISKFSADFTQLLFSTYFDPVSGLALDSSGQAYVGGSAPYDTSTGSQPVYVARIDSSPAAISLDSIASMVSSLNPSNFHGIAPGEVIRILGRNIGPANDTAGAVSGGVLAASLGGAQVIFDGVPAPLLFANAREIDLVAPFELAGKSNTNVQVQFNGARSNAVRVGVDATDPQILGVFNEDFTANSASNPAKAGSVITLYVAGVGQTDPPSPNGKINSASPAAAPAVLLQVRYIINNPNGNTELAVTFAGAAPGLAAGIFQVNFVAPPKSLSPVNLMVGGNFGPQFSVFVK